MSEQSLDQVISELREEGQHDSSGHFHIDFAARARKLAEHQSWEPALYLLQAVQAGVALKSPWLTIKLNRDLVEIGMAPPSGSLNLEALESGSAGESRYLGDLVKAAVAAGATGVSLTSDTEIWSWKDGTITYRPSPGPLRGGFPGADTKTLSIAVDHPKESLLARLFPSKRLAHVHQVLSTRCVLCPIPVRLDGRLLNLLYPEQAAWLRAGSIPATDWEGRRDYNWLGERHWLTSGPDSFCLASPACRTPYQVRVPSTVATHWGAQTSFTSVLSWFDGEIPEGAYAEISHSLQPSELPLQFKFDGPDLDTAQLVRTRVLAGVGGCLQGALSDSPWGHNTSYAAARLSAWVGIPVVARMASRLFYVKDGILLNSVPVKSSLPGTTVVLARADVKVDLSQLTVVRTAEVETDLAWVLAQEQELGGACRDLLRRPGGEGSGLPPTQLKKWQGLLTATS